MTAGSRMPRSSQGCFSSFFNFSNIVNKVNIFVCLFVNEEQAVGPGVLQTFSTCAVKP